VGAPICRLTPSLAGGCAGGTLSSEKDSALFLASTDPAELALPSVEQMSCISSLKIALTFLDTRAENVFYCSVVRRQRFKTGSNTIQKILIKFSSH
jgi:hypothetical protein